MRILSGLAPSLSILFGSHDDHRDICHLGSTGAHRRECLVTRGVEEGDRAVAVMDLIRADVLGDSAVFARCYLGLPDSVEQRGLAVVDVAHDGHHWRAVEELLF